MLTESEASCVVYGMPRAVAEAGLSVGQARIEDMGAAIRWPSRDELTEGDARKSGSDRLSSLLGTDGRTDAGAYGCRSGGEQRDGN